MEIPFNKLKEVDLIVDVIYKGGRVSGKGSEVLHHLLPGCSNSGGFRKVLRKDESKLPAYVVLYTSMEELAWPDYLDEETGVFRYFGDNRYPGKALLDTPRKGNLLLENVFAKLNSIDSDLSEIPPFFIFKKTGNGWDVQFLGLAVPGNPDISPDRDLVAFWRSYNSNRFQNYEAIFTVLDTPEPISKEWLDALIYNHDNSLTFAPQAWKRFIRNGRNGIKPLFAKKLPTIPSKSEQLPSDSEGIKCLEAIRAHYKSNPFGFENCAKNIIERLDDGFQDLELTKPWRDGGRDATGYYNISGPSHKNYPLRIECAVEAKCYNINSPVGVKQMSRLISRIRYRQFGIMITTSYVDTQAYKEIIEDGHPILIISAADIAVILRQTGIFYHNIKEWLNLLDEQDAR